MLAGEKIVRGEAIDFMQDDYYDNDINLSSSYWVVFPTSKAKDDSFDTHLRVALGAGNAADGEYWQLVFKEPIPIRSVFLLEHKVWLKISTDQTEFESAMGNDPQPYVIYASSDGTDFLSGTECTTNDASSGLVICPTTIMAKYLTFIEDFTTNMAAFSSIASIKIMSHPPLNDKITEIFPLITDTNSNWEHFNDNLSGTPDIFHIVNPTDATNWNVAPLLRTNGSSATVTLQFDQAYLFGEVHHTYFLLGAGYFPPDDYGGVTVKVARHENGQLVSVTECDDISYDNGQKFYEFVHKADCAGS